MTFNQFKAIAAQKGIEVFPHKQFGGVADVAVIFKPNGRTYSYRGTYAEILNKLGFKVVTKADVECVNEQLRNYEALKTEDFGFGFDFDYTDEINALKAKLDMFSREYIVV